MVPVSVDPRTSRTHVFAFLGWVRRPLGVWFSRPPKVVESPARVVFGGETHALDTPVVVEMWVDRLLDRDELRELCERHRTRGRIMRAIQG
jgi:hypothetical protein